MKLITAFTGSEASAGCFSCVCRHHAANVSNTSNLSALFDYYYQ